MTDNVMTDNERAQQIRARLNAATPGPWSYDGNPSRVVVADGGRSVTGCYNNGSEQDDRNAELIANAPADLAWLLDRCAVLEACAESEATRAAEAEAKLAKVRRAVDSLPNGTYNERRAVRLITAVLDA